MVKRIAILGVLLGLGLFGCERQGREATEQPAVEPGTEQPAPSPTLESEERALPEERAVTPEEPMTESPTRERPAATEEPTAQPPSIQEQEMGSATRPAVE